MSIFQCRQIFRSRKLLIDKLDVYYSCSNSVDIEKRRKELMARGLPKQKPIKGVKHVILVASGKGGVGKSTVSVNLALALKLKYPDRSIGLLDTDVFGPTVPLMMNLNDTPLLTSENLMVPLKNYDISCMSMGFLIEKDAAVIWRGLMVMQALEKLIRQVDWGETDFLIVDTPPGTGDTLLSLIQNVPITGAVIVTTPQSAALEVTKRGITMFRKMKIPVIGIVENMNYIRCTSCSSKIRVFGEGTSKLAEDLSCDIISSVPLNTEVSEGTDNGRPTVLRGDHSEVKECYRTAAERVYKFCEKR